MSYSRWSHSCWYVYHDANGGDTKDTQLLTVCDHGTYSYPDLKENMENILSSIAAERFERNPRNYKGEGEPPKDHFTEEEIEELRSYMVRFIKNCDFQFDPENIKKYGDIINIMGDG